MTTTQTPQHAASRGRRTWHFVRHYLEMVVAMVVGMVALGPVEDLLWPGLDDRLDVHVLVMATNMAIGMGAWMRFCGHSWRPIAEMSAAMYVPFAVLLVPYWAGAVPGGLLMTAGHVAMLPLMALAMLLRPAEYC
jgi:flagellar biosynthetic protein FliP